MLDTAHIVAWLRERMPDELSDAPPLPARVEALPLPPEDADEDGLDPDATAHDLEAIFTTIEYCDAKGVATRRRITMRRLKRGPNAPMLTAVCHERRAVRTFRCDRIGGFIEPDGEVIDCARFFREVLMIDLDQLAPTASPAVPGGARRIVDQLRAPLSLLAAAARSDDEFHEEELDVMCRYVEREIARPPLAGGAEPVGIETLDALTGLMRRMRPQRAELDGHLSAVYGFDDERLARFVHSLGALIIADGKVAMGEQLFLADLAGIRVELGGMLR